MFHGGNLNPFSNPKKRKPHKWFEPFFISIQDHPTMIKKCFQPNYWKKKGDWIDKNQHYPENGKNSPNQSYGGWKSIGNGNFQILN